MKFSELWLREWVNLSIDSKELVDQLTMSGLEVEKVKSVAGCFSGVVIGKIIECLQHPNNNALFITKVDIGWLHPLNIICSDSDCCVNLKVVVATLDSTLSGGGKVRDINLTSEPTEGILCSLFELGISSTENSGIIKLPSQAPIGHDIREYLKLNDNIIDISVTPNRADCFSLLGIARDIAACNRIPLHIPVIDKVQPEIHEKLSIQVDDIKACPRYISRIVKNINIEAETPIWMREKLNRCGFRLVNAVVDITNYIMLEFGQPMHVFDLSLIQGGIIVRHAIGGERFVPLCGNAVILFPETLVIADHSNVIAIAGILGSSNSSISVTTKDIVLECAFFDPLIIREGTRLYGLNTDASHRYERGVDPEIQACAIERATMLLINICGGKPGPVTDVVAPVSKLARYNNTIITLRRKALDCLIGHVISDYDVSDILMRLGCQVSRVNNDWLIVPPSWRFDIAIEEDLIEEVMRVYGYDAIPKVSVRANLLLLDRRAKEFKIKRAKLLLVDRGYQEVITYSFVDPKIQKLIHPEQIPLMLSNPISQDMSVMRLSLWTGLLGAMTYNQNRQQKRIRLFESGLCFTQDNLSSFGIRQDLMLGGIITGSRLHEHWDHSSKTVDFYDAKGDIEAILELTRKLNYVEFKAQQHPSFHPGQSALIYLNKQIIGFVGVVHPELASKLNLNGLVVLFELIWTKIAKYKTFQVNKVSKFPANRRDINVVVADNISAADVILECKKIIKNQLVEIKLFDVYRGIGVSEGYKSLAICLILQDTDRTLEEHEIAATVEKCVVALQHRFQASWRY